MDYFINVNEFILEGFLYTVRCLFNVSSWPDWVTEFPLPVCFLLGWAMKEILAGSERQKKDISDSIMT